LIRARLKIILMILMGITLLGSIYIVTITRSFQNQPFEFLKNTKVVKFRIDSNFSKQEIKQIKQALNDWTKLSGGLVKLEGCVVDIPFSELYSWKKDGKPTIYDATSTLYWPGHVALIFGYVYHYHLGFTFIPTGDIFILDGNEEGFKATVTHEIGHVIIGDYHSADPDDIMYPSLGESNRKITKGDIEALKAFQGVKNGQRPKD